MVFGYGVDEVASIISKNLLKRGHDVTVFTAWKEFQPEGFTVEAVKLTKLPSVLNSQWHIHFLTDFRATIPVVKVLKRYDLVITFDPMHVIGAVAKVVFRKPVLMHYFGVPPPSVLSSFKRKVEAMRQAFTGNRAFHFADYIVTNSKYTFGLLPEAVKRKALMNYHGVEHLINKDKEEARRLRERLGVEDKPLILSVGRFSTPYKGMVDMAKIFIRLKKRLRDVALLLVGRGHQQQVRELNRFEDVHVMTNVPYEILRSCFACCDVYCTASKWEGFNIPLVAAQANGKPVVAYNVGAHPEVVLDGETGFLAKSTSEFEEHLSLLARDSELRREMGGKAAKHAKNFTWSSSMDRLERLIDAVCEQYHLEGHV